MDNKKGRTGKAGSPMMGKSEPLKRSTQQGARSSRDSSLYRDVYDNAKARKDEGAELEESLHEAAEKLNELSKKISGGGSKSVGARAKRTPGNARFVVSNRGDEVVSVDHQAVIGELTATLESIKLKQTELEADLAGNHKANKLQIAQTKGRLAQLQRRKAEIESLLAANKTSAATPDTQNA